MTKVISFVNFKDSKNLKKLTKPSYDTALQRQNIIKNLDAIMKDVLKADKTKLRDDAVTGIIALIVFFRYTDLKDLK